MFRGLLILVCCSVLPLAAVEIRVNPAVGIEEIQKRVRAKIAEGLKEDLHVVMETGMYRLKKPWEMDARDCDPTGKHKVIYRKAKPDDPLCKVAISGGVEVRGWRKEEDGTWTAKIPRGVGEPREMFNGITRLKRARFPNEGWLRVEKVGEDRRTNFIWGEYTTDLKGGRKGHLNGKKLVGAELIFLHDWSMSRIEIEAMDDKERRLTLKHPAGCVAAHYAMDHFEKQARYAIEGHPSLIDQPGEWAIDDSSGEKRIRYMPRREQKIEDFTPTLPRLTKLLTIAGTKENPLKNIYFQGLFFAHCAWKLPEGGYASGQATIHEQRTQDDPSKRIMIPAAVTLDYVKDSGFKGGRFFMLGGNGLWMRRGCEEIWIEKVDFSDISGNGLMIGDVADHKEDTTEGVSVDGCVVEECGAQFFGAVGIWQGIANRSIISENSVRNLPYTGISIGWRWNDELSSANNNHVLRNHIHEVMQVLSDGGGIYTLGRQPMSFLHENHIHGIPTNAGRAESNGIFMDQGSSEFMVVENLIYDVAKSPLRFHRALENDVGDNKWLVAKGLPAIRYNNTDKKLIELEENEVLTPEELQKAVKEWLEEHGK